MGNCQSSGLKELFEEVIANENKQQDATQPSGSTPDRMTLVDPRSPLVDAERTPIEVLFKSVSLTHVPDETDDVTPHDGHRHKRQLEDPRSATAGIQRTPIVVGSPLEENSDNTEDAVEQSGDVEDGQEFAKLTITDTPVMVCDMSQKLVAVAKKLTFDISPSLRTVKTAEVTSTAHSRTPLAHLQANTPTGSRGGRPCRRLSGKGKPSGPMSPLQLLHVRQRLAVKRALQLTQAQQEAGVDTENRPCAATEGSPCRAAVQPVRVSASPSLAAKDPALRF